MNAAGNRHTARFDWIVPAILLAGFALRAIGLDAQSLFNEEGYSIWLSQLGAGRVLAQTASLDSNTPLHYLLLGSWISLAGASEFSARFLSACAGTLTIAVAWALARVLAPSSSSAGAWAAGLVALLPVAVDVSQEARMYALLMLFTTLSTLLLARGLSFDRGRDWALWAIFAVAAFATHVLGALVFAAQALVAGASWLRGGKRKRRSASLPIAIALTGALVGVWVIVIVAVSAPTMTTYGGGLGYLGLLQQGLAANLMPRLRDETVTRAIALIAAGLLAISLAIGTRRSRQVLILALVTIMAIAAVGARTGKYGWLYASALAPAFAASIGATLAQAQGSARRRGLAKTALPVVGLVMAAAGGLALMSWRDDPTNVNEDFRGAVRHIRDQLASDEVAVIVPDYSWTFEYYFGPTSSEGRRWFALPEMPMLNVADTLDYNSAVPALNRALAGKGGAWLLLYDETLLDPSHLTQALLRRQAQGLGPVLDTTEFHGLRLMRFRFFQPYEALPERIPDMDSRLEPLGAQRGLSALGCHQFTQPKAGDAWMEVTCFWRLEPSSNVPWDTKVSLRLIDAAGAQVLQSDQLVAPHGLPVFAFDKPITAFYVIEMPATLAPGDYTLVSIPYTGEGQVAPQVSTPIHILDHSEVQPSP